MKPKISSAIFSPETIAAAIAAAPEHAVSDPDSPPSRPGDWDDAIVVHDGGYPAIQAALEQRRRARGPSRKPTKEMVAIRFSPEVLAAFRAGGPGWQTRMDRVLLEWVRSHPTG